MKLLKVFIFLLSFSIEAQTSIEREFISNILGKETNQNIVYTDKIPKNELNDVIDALKKNIILKVRMNDANPDDKLKLTKKEVSKIAAQFECANKQSWAANKLPQYKYIPNDTITKFPSKYSNLYFYSFTKPVFIRNNTMVVFYYQANEWGALRVYYKEKDIWNYYILYTWVS